MSQANRFTFELGESGEKALEEIRAATSTSSKSKVLRNALALYEVLVKKAQEGYYIFVGADRGSAAEVVMPSLKRAAKRVLSRSCAAATGSDL